MRTSLCYQYQANYAWGGNEPSKNTCTLCGCQENTEWDQTMLRTALYVDEKISPREASWVKSILRIPAEGRNPASARDSDIEASGGTEPLVIPIHDLWIGIPRQDQSYSEPVLADIMPQGGQSKEAHEPILTSFTVEKRIERRYREVKLLGEETNNDVNNTSGELSTQRTYRLDLCIGGLKDF
ncbi:hypothetical protein MMC07_008459 [Pseudocyphellaria aurata]|nr:hypothetical protein [Pseudocyphellaria aurata]